MAKQNIYYISCDESRQNQRYMLLGGLIIHRDKIDKFNSMIRLYRDKYNMKAELKWTKVSQQKFQEYKLLIDDFFILNNANDIQFKCIVVDTHKIDNLKFNSNNYEIGFYKFYYQLLLNSFAKNFCNDRIKVKFIVNLDHRISSYSLNDLKEVLNNGCKSKGFSHSKPFLSIEPIDSKKSDLIQLNDIILGSIGFIRNGFDRLPNSSEAKIKLASYIKKKSNITSYEKGSTYYQRRFNVWNFRMK